MKGIGNWKTWENYGKRRIYFREGCYADEGVTGLLNGHGMTASEINFIVSIFGGKPNFETVWEYAKNAYSSKRAAKKAARAK